MNKLIKVGAKWCGPCKMMEAKLESIDSDLVTNIVNIDIDSSEGKEFSSKHQIRSIPVLMIQDSQGNVLDRLPPSTQQPSIDVLKSFISKYELATQ